MRSRIGTRLVILACTFAMLAGSGTLSLTLAAPGDQPGTQPESTSSSPLVPLPGRATETPDRVPPQRVTPTPTPAGIPPSRATEVPTREPRGTEAPPVVPTVQAPDPMPDPPQGDTPPTTPPPAGNLPWLPGVHNRFEITAYTCPAGTSFSLDEAGFLAACPLYLDAPEQPVPPDSLGFQLRDGDQTHDDSDVDDDGVFIFDDITITPGLKFFIVEEFLDGFADPAVFCSESPLPHSRMATDFRTIRPQLSAWSDVTYTCSWFRMPLTSNTVRVIDMACSSMTPPPGAGFTWFWGNCRAPINQHGYTLTDSHSSRYASTLNGQVRWANVNFGAVNTVTVTRSGQLSSSVGHKVYCGDFNSGSEVMPVNGSVPIAKGSGASLREYVCRWFHFDNTPSTNDALQIPSTLTVRVQACPAGFDRNSNQSQLFNGCTDPAGPVEVAVTYPNGDLVIHTTTDSAPAVAGFGLIGQGWVTAVPNLPNDSRVMCESVATQNLEFTNGVNIQVNLPFTWGWGWYCTWFVFTDT